jgi:hypothetical protein
MEPSVDGDMIDRAVTIVTQILQLSPLGRVTVLFITMALGVLSWKFKSEITKFLQASAARIREAAFNSQRQESIKDNAATEAEIKKAQDELASFEDDQIKQALDALPMNRLIELASKAFTKEKIQAILVSTSFEAESRVEIYKLYGLKKKE